MNDTPDDRSSSSPFPLAPGTSASVTVDGLELIVAEHNGEMYAYENLCPHAGETLDPMGGSVSNEDGSLLRCQRHAAEFLTRTGECVGGPCIGERLQAVAVIVVGDTVYLD